MQGTILLYGTAMCLHAQDAGQLLELARNAAAAKKHDSALYWADKALPIATKACDTPDIVKAMRIKGKALLTLGKEKEPADLFFAALNLCTTPHMDREKGLLYGEVGYYYFSQGNAKEAKAFYHKNIALLSRVMGPDSVGNQLINLSVAHNQLRELDSARMALMQVLAIANRSNDSSMKAYALLNLGAYYTDVNQPDSAKVCYLQAYDLWKALGNTSQLFRVTFNLGFYAYQKKNYKEALRYYHLSEEAAAKYGLKRELAHVKGTMAESYGEIGDFKNAYIYLHDYATMNDSFNKADLNEYAMKLDRQYQADQARLTIQAQELQIRKQQNTNLIILIIALIVISAGAAGFAWLTFRARVRRKVEDARKRFFANVAHEIRTPLSTIQGPLEVLTGLVQDAGMQQQLAIATRSSQRLGDLINQMLDISKIEAEKYTLQEHAGSVTSLMERLHEAYATQAATKNIVLKTECDAAATVYFDKDALEKVANNLMGNALKYTPPNGHVGIDTTLQPNGNNALLTMRVWDNGPGISVKDQERIFERFYRATDSTAATGAGIGLALVKELVQLMNGTIAVDSAPGRGTVFTVQLPLRMAATMPEVTASGTNGMVLIAEDDAEIRSFTAGLLQGKGYAVQGVADGTAALAAAGTTLPDLIITDMMMPGMDGAAMIQALRHNEMTAHIPVIVLSARAAAEAKTEALAAGAQAYLTKPFSPAELTGVVYNQLDILRRQQEKYRQQVTNETQNVAERVQEADPFAKRCHELILEHLDDAQLSVERLAEMMHVNRSHFQRKIKALTGFSPSEMIRTIRLEKAREMLMRREGNITETAYATGFTSQSYFTRCFSEHFGYPPSEVLYR